MKLRNKHTGETGNLITICASTRVFVDGKSEKVYNSLAELNEEWEDYEEPKDYYFIRSESLTVGYSPISNTRSCRNRKEIGNYFETREEAEKAVEKLKAWKRLRDKGFRFEGIKEDFTRILQSQEPFRTGKRYLQFNKSEDEEWMEENWEDLDLLFGGEE